MATAADRFNINRCARVRASRSRPSEPARSLAHATIARRSSTLKKNAPIRAPILTSSAPSPSPARSQLEHLQSRYVGTGHADTNRFEWAVNIHRDSYASYFGHHPMMQYFALAENESIGRVKYNMMQKMLLPCGLPPERDEE